MSDYDLQRLLDKDLDEWDKLINKHMGLLISVAFSILKNSENAKDAVQQTLIIAVRVFKKKDLNHIKNWLLKICRNKSKDILRKQKRLSECELEENINPPSPEVKKGIVNFEVIFPILTNKEKFVIDKIFREGWTAKDVAKHEKVSEAAISKRVHKAIKKIQNIKGQIIL